MRELLFKNLTSQNTRKRILCISERIAQGGIEITTQRRCTYRLKNCIQVKNLADLSKLKKLSKSKQTQKRHFYVIRKCDSRTGENKLLCRVHGLLYVVMGNQVYLVAFTHSFKIGFRKLTCSQK